MNSLKMHLFLLQSQYSFFSIHYKSKLQNPDREMRSFKTSDTANFYLLFWVLLTKSVTNQKSFTGLVKMCMFRLVVLEITTTMAERPIWTWQSMFWQSAIRILKDANNTMDYKLQNEKKAPAHLFVHRIFFFTARRWWGSW